MDDRACAILDRFHARADAIAEERVLSLHPNSLRYRLRRIAEATGRDPRRLSHLLELIAAARVGASEEEPIAEPVAGG